MAERKVLTKYISPGFDPDRLQAGKKRKHGIWNIRMMLPMSIRCTTCGEFLPAGTKLNSRQEIAWEKTYLDLRVYRFYMKCTRCSSEFSIKTNPKDDDYVCEFGCQPHYTPHWKFNEKEKQEAIEERKKEDENAIQALENRRIDNKMDLDIQDALLETRDINRRNHNADIDKIIEIRRKQEQDRIAREKKQKEEEEEDMGPPEIFIRRLDPNLKKGLTVVDSSSNNPFSNHKSTPSLQTQAPVPRGIPASIMPDYPTTVQHSTDSSAFNRPTPMLSLVSNREPQTPFISHNPDQPAMEPLEVPVDDHEYQSFVAYRPNLLSFSEDEDEEAEEDMFKLPASSKKKQDVQPQPEPQPQPEIQKTKRQSSDDGEAVPVKKIQKEVPETFSKLAALLDYSDSEDDD